MDSDKSKYWQVSFYICLLLLIIMSATTLYFNNRNSTLSNQISSLKSVNDQLSSTIITTTPSVSSITAPTKTQGSWSCISSLWNYSGLAIIPINLTCLSTVTSKGSLNCSGTLSILTGVSFEPLNMTCSTTSLF